MSAPTTPADAICANSCACASFGNQTPFDATTLAACNTICAADLNVGTSKQVSTNVCSSFNYDTMSMNGNTTCATLCASDGPNSQYFTTGCTQDVCTTQCTNYNLCYPVAQNNAAYGNGLDAWPSQ